MWGPSGQLKMSNCAHAVEPALSAFGETAYGILVPSLRNLINFLPTRCQFLVWKQKG